MISYMVVLIAFNFIDIWSEVLFYNIGNIEEAEDLREQYLKDHPNVVPENVHVIQYKE